MAITFTPQSGSALTIGGQSSGTISGPFPNFSVSKEVRRQDGLILGEKFTINITGVALITSGASHTTKGARQAALITIANNIVTAAIGAAGTLQITGYGGSGSMSFSNCILVSAEAQDQDEATMGTQNQPYSFTFEATSGAGADVGSGLLESFEESWDSSVQEGPYSYNGGAAYRTWTVTHSVSAQAVNPYPDDSAMGWVVAKSYVDSKLVSDPFGGGLTDQRNQSVTVDTASGLTAYNHVRQRTQNIATGSYSVQDTWVGSPYPASHTVEYSLNLDATAEYNTVDVNVSAQGYESGGPESGATSSKYSNAQNGWGSIKTAAENGATAFYSSAGGTGTLRTIKRATSESHNETDGSLNYTCTFDDAKIHYPNAISESLTVTYNNEDALNQVVVVIPVLEKPDGPVIQDMQTTNEKTVSASLDLGMNRDSRTAKPNGDSLVGAYAPAGGYRRSRTESWNPYSGSYNLSVEWVYV
jgi:hypothetical protein